MEGRIHQVDPIQVIMTRRSIRRFTSRPVLEKEVEVLLRAAMAAPSSGNQQPWHFIVIRDRAILDAIMEVHPHAHMLREAPLAILVCADLDRQVHAGYWAQDCSAATENLLLAAHAKGLGAVWLGVHPRPERIEAVRGLLALPERIEPLALVAVGYPAEKPSQPDRFDRSRIHVDRW